MTTKQINFVFKGSDRTTAATNSVSRGLDNVRTEFNKTRNAMVKFDTTNKSMMKNMSANRRIIQGVGMQVSDFAVQVAGGQSAILALTQNVPQVVQMFGAFGGVLAGLITVVGALALTFQKSGQGLNELLPFAGVLEDDFRKLGEALKPVASAFIDIANAIINNLDIALIVGGLFAGFYAGKYVFAMKAAIFSTAGLTKAIATLRSVMVTTGIGALIVGVAILIERFMALTQVMGGVGKALVLVRKVAAEAFDNIELNLIYLYQQVNATTEGITAAFLDGFATILEKSEQLFFNPIGEKFNQLGNVFRSLLGKDIKAFDPKPFSAGLNKLATDIEKNAEKWRGLAETSRKALMESSPALRELLAQFDKISEKKIDLSDIFGKSEEKDTGGLFDQFTNLEKQMMGPLEALRSQFQERTKIIDDALAAEVVSFERAEQLKQGVQQDFAQQESTLRALQNQKIAASFEESSRQALDSIKTLFGEGSALAKVAFLAHQAAAAATVVVDTQVAAIKALATLGPIAGPPVAMAMRASGALALAAIGAETVRSFEGGGKTGSGPRVGGVDGRGGMHAIVHPDETIIDNRAARYGGAGNGSQQRVTIDVRAYIDDNGNLKAMVERVANDRANVIVRNAAPQIVRQSVNETYRQARENPIR